MLWYLKEKKLKPTELRIKQSTLEKVVQHLERRTTLRRRYNNDWHQGKENWGTNGWVLTLLRKKTYPFISRSACDLMDIFKKRWLSSKVASSSRFMLREINKDYVTILKIFNYCPSASSPSPSYLTVDMLIGRKSGSSLYCEVSSSTKIVFGG